MPPVAVPVYENHLKGSYSVPAGGRLIAVTDTSCYTLSEETAWLVNELPASGDREAYLGSLAALGLNDPGRIFGKLLDLGVLREKAGRSLRGILGALLTPKIKLISAQLQSKAFGRLLNAAAGLNPAGLGLAVMAAAGFFWGAWLQLAGPETALPVPLAGRADGAAVIALVIAGSLLHELGHSFAAAYSGIGFRPIGFSVYLIYPVFYTNVSGMEKLSLKEKVLIDCGGFILQFIYVLFLLLAASVSGNASAASAVRWIMVIIFFNLNPFLRTDGYWLYKDAYSELKSDARARAVHYAYIAAFFVFSVYFLWLLGSRVGGLWRELAALARSPEHVFSEGYRVLLGAYFVTIGLAGGLRRFREGQREWSELRSPADTPLKGE